MMMENVHHGTVKLTILVTIVSCCFGLSNAAVYYVKPNENTTCSHIRYECHTLSYYLNVGSYFRSNTTMVFLQGTHSANRSAIIEQVSSLTLVGESGSPEDEEPSAKIKCTQESVGFEFINVIDLHIENLTFSECGQALPKSESHTHSRAAVRLKTVTNLSLFGISVSKSKGYGIYADQILGSSYIQDSTFIQNNGSDMYQGGNAILFYSHCPNTRKTNSLHIEGSRFLSGHNPHHGSLAAGLTLFIECTNVRVTLNNVTFQGNEAFDGGNLAIIYHNVTHNFVYPVIVNNSQIENGRGHLGGGMFVTFHEEPAKSTISCSTLEATNTIMHISNTNFSENHAVSAGGGMYLRLQESPSVFCNTREIKIENCTFERNTLAHKSHGGVAVHTITMEVPSFLRHGMPQFETTFALCKFFQNLLHKNAYNASGSGAVFTIGSPNTNFIDCILENNSCTAISSIKSNLIFEGNNTIRYNNGSSGGGLVLCQDSFMFLKPHSIVTFDSNKADHVGGAIYIEKECLQSKPACFFQPHTDIIVQPHLLNTTRVRLLNNQAKYAGTAIYGGSVDYCYFFRLLSDIIHQDSAKVFDEVFDQSNSSSFISSDPYDVCLCNITTNMPICNTINVGRAPFPGQNFTVTVAIAGQRAGTVPGVVLARVAANTKGNPTLGNLQNSQTISTTSCTNLSYAVFSNQTSESVILTVQQSEISSVIPHYHRLLHLTVSLLPCPIGFQLRKDVPVFCDCHPMLAKLGFICHINNQTIQRPPREWVGYYNRSSENGTTETVILNGKCPFDFCKSYKVDLTSSNVTLTGDEQCAFHRTGVLCGACTHGLSIVLGNSKCLPCSNVYLLLLIPFALAGLFLVIFLIACNLTVSEGTMSGLIFYANIVQVNRTTFFPDNDANSLTVFIAWLNLDLGIQTCFYNGMNAYTKAWLQFVFPIYIWLIAGLIILLSRRYNLVARLMGKNAVKVLATLFLLSFAKLQRAIISAFSFTLLTPSVGKDKYVWLLDGKVTYLKGIHITFFVTALIASLLLLLYTGMLLFIQCLQRSNFRVLATVKRLKPLFDAYTGPFKDNCGFWTGLLLLIRSILLVIFAVNVLGENSLNLLTIAIASLLILAVAWAFHSVYKKQYLNVLESFFFLNLGILSSGVCYAKIIGWSTKPVTFTSVGITFLVLIAILLFHTYKQVASSKKWRRFLAWLAKKKISQTVIEPVDQGDLYEEESDNEQLPPVVRFNEYREPLLSSHAAD